MQTETVTDAIKLCVLNALLNSRTYVFLVEMAHNSSMGCAYFALRTVLSVRTVAARIVKLAIMWIQRGLAPHAILDAICADTKAMWFVRAASKDCIWMLGQMNANYVRTNAKCVKMLIHALNMYQGSWLLMEKSCFASRVVPSAIRPMSKHV